MKRWTVLFVPLALIVAACGGGGDLAIDDAWARTSANMQNAGAAYMTITGGDTADRLIGVSVPSEVAAMAELHETAMGMGDDGESTGMMMMQQVPSIEVPADAEVMLEPGGFHVMMMNLAAPLETGSTFDVTLMFESAGEVSVSVEVREN
ncbi:MAG: copper chaperone PCu(A)C [Acidimicrobiia bacterium]